MRAFFDLFFDQRYLRGKHFDNSLQGWKWALRGIFWQKVLRLNSHIPWPVSPFVVISSPDNIFFHVDGMDNFQAFRNYFQDFNAEIHIGEGTYIAPGVGIITANHDPVDLDNYLEGKNVVIGKNCWIGMNAVILPGVELGENTIVGAGSIVTKSYTQGHILIAGNPAKIVKTYSAASRQDKLP